MESMRLSFAKPKYQNLSTVAGGALDFDAKFGNVESNIPTPLTNINLNGKKCGCEMKIRFCGVL